MASIDINIGTAADSGNGDNLRAFATNVAAMFAEIYGLGTAESDLATGTAFRPALSLIADQAANTVVVRDANSSGTLSAKAVADTQLLIGDGTGFTAAALSGDVTMTNAGVVTIANDAVETAMIADNVGLGGSPTTTTQSASDNSTKIATTAYTDTAIANLVDSSPSALNTLNELAAALGDDASFATTMTNALAGKQATITGAATTIDTEDLTASRALVSNASGKVEVSAVTSTEVGYLDGVTSAIQTQLDAKIGTGAGAVGASNIAANAATPAKVSLFDDNTVATDTHILIADGTDFINKAVSGDITIANTGAVTIANGAVENAMLADDAVGADELASNAVVTASIVDLNVTTGKIAADAITGAKIADDAVDSEHYTDGSIDTAHIADDNVTHAKLEARYTAKATSTSTGDQNINALNATTFLLTGNVATATLTIQNMKLGQVIDIVLSGTLSSAAITLADDFTSSTIRRIGSTELDQSATNVITVTCIDDTDSAALLHYTINTFATDTTP